MKKITKLATGLLCLLFGINSFAACNTVGSGGQHSSDDNIDLTNAITMKADFNEIIDPPLLKKVAMYNAGCIQPLTNYERDFDRIKELNADALRIDLSLGKSGGTAGQYLVGEDYDYKNYNSTTGTFEVVKDSLTYDFSQLDGIVDYMNQADVLPYMSWSYIPFPLQQDGKWNNLDTNITNWKEIWEETFYQYAKHYKDTGVRIGYHEIYNEPDLEILKCWGVFDNTFDGFLSWDDFCLGSQCAPGNGVYPDMYEYGAKGILRADPDATIGGPAFALGEIGVESWVGFLPRVLEKQLPLDFYSFHTYLDGNTWFMSDEERANGGKNEIEKVVDGLASDSYFIKSAIHINEYSYLNDKNGSSNGLNSPYNYYGGAWQTIDGLMEAINRSTIQWIYWAQFMESTGGYDPYGLIEHVGGNVKAPFNALKIYADMPVWRYDSYFAPDSDGLQSLVSSTDDKIGILLWNTNSAVDENGNKTTAGDRTVRVELDNAKFGNGTRRVYRIDENHASYFDNNNNAELVAEAIANVKTDSDVWVGNIPADGMVYITINKDGAEDFTDYENRTSDFASDIKTQYYYEDRYRGLEGSRGVYQDYVEEISGSYSHFDRTTWTMYLGMGSATGKGGKYEGQAHANGAVICENLPEKFKVGVKAEGEISMVNKNTTLGFRVDFYDETTGKYTNSVYFYKDDLYRTNRDPKAQDSKVKNLSVYPWGTQKKADVAVSMSGDVWDIDLSKYAPDGWNAETGRVQISFDMQNTGANTRAMFSLYE